MPYSHHCSGAFARMDQTRRGSLSLANACYVENCQASSLSGALLQKGVGSFSFHSWDSSRSEGRRQGRDSAAKRSKILDVVSREGYGFPFSSSYSFFIDSIGNLLFDAQEESRNTSLFVFR